MPTFMVTSHGAVMRDPSITAVDYVMGLQERFPTAPVPEYLRDRSLSGRELPAVELLSMPPAAEGGGGGGGRAGDKEDNKPEVAKVSRRCTTTDIYIAAMQGLPVAS